MAADAIRLAHPTNQPFPPTKQPTKQLAAPSLHLPSECDDYGNGYPFSVPPDEPLTPQDLMRFQRDHYEGTPYDLTQGIAGAFGF